MLDYLKQAFEHIPHQKCFLMVDIRGRDITIGAFENNEPYIEIESGEDIELYIDIEGELKSNSKRLVTSELGIERILRKGDIIYIGDGTIKASVLNHEDGVTILRTKSEGRLYEYSSIIVADKHSSLSVITEQDIDDLEYLNKKHKIDYITVPYATSDEDIKVVRRLTPFLENAVILAKIEDKNPTILNEADGIIIQRRSLGLSIVSEKLFALQNLLLEQCKLKAKPVIIANEIIESMIDEKKPLRSEISDMQNALVEGADAVLLDRETSYGDFPAESVAVVSQAIAQTSDLIDPHKKFRSLYELCDFGDRDEILVMSVAKIILAQDREPIDYIMTLSKDGKFARLLAKYMLPIKTIACCPDTLIVKQLSLVTSINSMKVPNYTSKLLGPDHLIQIIMRSNKSLGLGTPGNFVIIFRSENEGTPDERPYFKFEKVPE